MNHPLLEIREMKPARKVQFCGDVINLENVLTKTVSTGLFRKSTLTLKLKTGEVLTYEADKEEIDGLFAKK